MTAGNPAVQTPLPDVARQLDAHADAIASAATEKQFDSDPTLLRRYGEKGKAKCTEDARRHLSYLSSSVSHGSPGLFTDYIKWAKILVTRLGLSAEDIARNLEYLRESVQESLPADAALVVARTIDAGLAELPSMPDSRESFLALETAPHAVLAREYLRLLLAGDRHAASTLILEAVSNGVDVRDIYIDVFQKSQYEIGRMWQMNEVSVAQEHFCTAATQLIMSQLYSRIFSTARVGRRLVAACVGSDLHEIGVRMVADFFEMEGWDTYYLGANTPVAGLLQSLEEHRPDVLAISATMSYHVPKVAEAIDAVRGSSVNCRVMVGGYPFAVDNDLWRSVGADGCATDAPGAVSLADRLLAAR